MRSTTIRRKSRSLGRRVLRGTALALAVAMSQPGVSKTTPPYLVIVHPSNPVESITRQRLSKIFLRKIESWDRGLEIVPIEQPSGSPVRSAFVQMVYRKPEAALDTYWKRRVFSGRGTPPEIAESQEEVLRRVQRDPRAVGYVSADAIIESVKVVEVSYSD